MNFRYRRRLKNKDFSLISSNCAAGFVYHWLNLKFTSPFINLYLDNEDFLLAMENFEEFLSHEIAEDTSSDKDYPVGIGYKGVKIHFLHYPTFEEAIEKWNERKKRINFSNLIVWLSNYDSLKYKDKDDIINRFNALPFKNKLIFSAFKSDLPNVVQLKDIDKESEVGTIWRNNTILGKRYIDQFDFIGYINEAEIN